MILILLIFLPTNFKFLFLLFYDNLLYSYCFYINYYTHAILIIPIYMFYRIVNTPYEVLMGEDISCRLLCHETSKEFMNWDEANSQHVIQMVQHEYFVHL